MRPKPKYKVSWNKSSKLQPAKIATTIMRSSGCAEYSQNLLN